MVLAASASKIRLILEAPVSIPILEIEDLFSSGILLPSHGTHPVQALACRVQFVP